MHRSFLLLALLALAAACDSSKSKTDRVERDQARVARDAAVHALRRDVEARVLATSAVALFPDDTNWSYRYQIQDHLSSLEGGNALVRVQVEDVTRGRQGLIVEGTPHPRPDHDVLIWLRLHEIPDSLFAESDGFMDKVTCIGQLEVTVPPGPQVELAPISEDEVEAQMSKIPLVVDISCINYWLET